MFKWDPIYTFNKKFRLYRQKYPDHSWAQIHWDYRHELNSNRDNPKEKTPKHFDQNKRHSNNQNAQGQKRYNRGFGRNQGWNNYQQGMWQQPHQKWQTQQQWGPPPLPPLAHHRVGIEVIGEGNKVDQSAAKIGTGGGVHQGAVQISPQVRKMRSRES